MKTNHKQILSIAAALILGLVAGKIFFGSGMQHAGHAQGPDGKVEFWTCSMHPQIQLPASGKCPICGMALIPVSADAGSRDLPPQEIKLSPRAEQLAEIEVVPVVRKFVNSRIRLVGKVEYDETRLRNITAWVPGRLDRLYVDYTGISVRKGDHLVSLYSPDLLAAQEELIQAAKTIEKLKDSDIALVRDRTQTTLQSSREKLKLLGLTEEQISTIEKSGLPEDHITIHAPMSGIVIHKNALEGEYVETGSKIYTIADLSKLWIKLDAYESDLAWLHFGQDVELETEAYPGDIFHGRIAFIAPVLNPVTRTVKVRVNVENDDLKLKPGMFVRAQVNARAAEGGKIFSPDLVGKWISPMHPEIIRDKPGDCDICGMELVSAESLGYRAAGQEKPPLIIPASAALITGTRAVVFVKVPEKEGHYAGREVVLGSRAGDYYIVHSGLTEGELVVTRGSFKLDSAVQILAKPSMMNPRETPPGKLDVPTAFLEPFKQMLDGYYRIQKALAADHLAAVKLDAVRFKELLAMIDTAQLEGPAHLLWMKHQKTLNEASDQMGSATDLEPARLAFDQLSKIMIAFTESFGLPHGESLYVMHCPMAFDHKGASWLQPMKKVWNPYFGAAMLHCGDVEKTMGAPVEKVEKGHDHDEL